ncbi:MAG: ComF family protein, partial [Leptolyngbya sp. SIO1D8]|nr:ComF family protein [Leptolyngbya sp. SIO1D8]
MWNQALQAITTLFLQQTCPLCDRATPQEFCQDCWRQLEACAHRQPAEPAPAALPVLTWGCYEATLKQAMAALKYDGHQTLARPLGQALGQCWQTFPLATRRSPLIVPIPLHDQKRRERGFNQAELLADAFCQQTGLRLVRRGLVRQRATIPQFNLGVAERQKNLAGAFTLGPTFCSNRSQAPVLLLDDIYTTGTTVRAAASTSPLGD